MRPDERSERGFEARNLRFVYVDNPTLLNEVIFSRITFKHFIGLAIAGFLGILALNTGNPVLVAIFTTIGLLILACAFYPPKALTLESTLVGGFFTLFDIITQGANPKKVVKTKPVEIPTRSPNTPLNITIRINPEELVNRGIDLAELARYEPLAKRKSREVRAKKKEKEKR